jgi:hypothetical protein
MVANDSYFELYVHGFEQIDERVQVLPEVTPHDLVAAILDEFAELDYLGVDPSGYRLCRREGDTEAAAELDIARPLRAQVASGDHLLLVEQEPGMPSGTCRPAYPIYLQEHDLRRAFRVGFIPAIVGRSDPNLSDDYMVAVDLSGCHGANRVSRRHLILRQDESGVHVQSLSSNSSTLIHDDTEEIVPGAPDFLRVVPGDVIRLDRSGIRLKLVVREG